MRATTRIERALSGAIVENYREQLASVRRFVSGLSHEEALSRLQQSMLQLFSQSLALEEELAAALARLATELPPLEPKATPLVTVIERCALQRALVAAGLGRDVRPYYEIAARAALEGLSISEKGIIVPDPNERLARIPTLPPLHGQDRSLENAGPSPYFQTKWD